ncbi:non-SMC mitotic condensation complex subunit 1-domain-containing protein [Blastocladiella britannica]|nr:non-SMC mitotic condensation complex subunit 1-domain-containing protein [Blastocladiella britannica]
MVLLSDPEPATALEIGLADLGHVVDALTDSLASDPLLICRPGALSPYSRLLGCLPHIPAAPLPLVSRLLDLIVTNLTVAPAACEVALSHRALTAAGSSNGSSQGSSDANLDVVRMCLHRWLSLAHDVLVAAEHRSIHLASAAAAADAASGALSSAATSARAPARKRARTANHPGGAAGSWDWDRLKLGTMDAFSTVLRARVLSNLSDGDRTGLVSLVGSSVVELLQNKARTSLKLAALKKAMFSVYGDCIVEHRLDAMVAMEQNLKFFDYLAEPLGEFLAYLEHQHQYSALTLALLRSIGSGESGIADGAAAAKSVAAFLIALANLVPRTVARSLVYLQAQLENSDYSVRIAVVHCISMSVRILVDPESAAAATAAADNKGLDPTAKNQEEDAEDEEATTGPSLDESPRAIATLLDALKARLRDIHNQVRKKVMTVITELLDFKYFYIKFPDQWLDLMDLAVGRLHDKNQPVRAAAIKAVTMFLVRHPFTMHGAAALDSAGVDALAKTNAMELRAVLDRIEQGETGDADMRKMDRYDLRHKYFTHLQRFVAAMDKVAVPALVQLLASKSKVEVMDAMDFFVEAHGAGLAGAAAGLAKMWTLIFNVRNSDHAKDVHTRLVECFRSVHLRLPTAATTTVSNGEADYAVRSLVRLTYGATTADITCLDAVVGLTVKSGYVDDRVAAVLWSYVATTCAPIPQKQRRGAALVLSWLCRAQPSWLGGEQVAVVVRAFRTHGARDPVLARYLCLIVQSLPGRLSIDHELFPALAAMIQTSAPEEPSSHAHLWFPMAQEIVRTIFAICEQPLKVADHVLRSRSQAVFGTSSAQVSERALAELLFLVGHVAVETLVLLEAIETVYKQRQGKSKSGRATAATPASRKSADMAAARRLSMSRRSRASGAMTPAHKASGRSRGGGGAGAESGDDMDGVVGSVEDVFTDNLARVRELELLAGKDALLAVYGPVVAELVASPTTPASVRRIAVATLAQLMCVSAEFCEDQLPLLHHVLTADRQGADPDVSLRSNVMIAVGDLVVSWSTVVDAHVSMLYDALRTSVEHDPRVKKAALMVLLHLILNGMVKVKGHLATLAMCLEDPDERIAGLTKLFLAELAGKEQALYNNLSDAVSNLLAFGSGNTDDLGALSGSQIEPTPTVSEQALLTGDQASDLDDDEEADNSSQPRPETKRTVTATTASQLAAPSQDDETSVYRVLKYLFGFITKDRQVENLIKKLCLRLKDSTDERQWRAVTFALAHLPWETGVEAKCRRLLEHAPSLTAVVHEPTAYRHLKDMLVRAGKGSAGSSAQSRAGGAAAAASAAGGGAGDSVDPMTMMAMMDEQTQETENRSSVAGTSALEELRSRIEKARAEAVGSER